MNGDAAAMASKQTLHVRIGFASDIGRIRDRNEDAFALRVAYPGERSWDPWDGYFLVADGVGGHARGDVASRFVADCIARALESDSAPPAYDDRARWLAERVRQANLDLIERGGSPPGSHDAMGTTLTVAALADRCIHLAHVGDSRCYRFRAGLLETLTRDDSWVGEQVRAGVLSVEEAAVHPRRHWLTQSLGTDAAPEVFVASLRCDVGDRYLLCTDGLHGALTDSAIARVLEEEPDPQAAVRRLIDLANGAGGRDNITAIVVDVIATTSSSIPTGEGSNADPSPSRGLGMRSIARSAEGRPGRARRTIIVAAVLLGFAIPSAMWIRERPGAEREHPASPPAESQSPARDRIEPGDRRTTATPDPSLRTPLEDEPTARP
jgi:PPM family protein phosphatase